MPRRSGRFGVDATTGVAHGASTTRISNEVVVIVGASAHQNSAGGGAEHSAFTTPKAYEPPLTMLSTTAAIPTARTRTKKRRHTTLCTPSRSFGGAGPLRDLLDGLLWCTPWCAEGTVEGPESASTMVQVASREVWLRPQVHGLRGSWCTAQARRCCPSRWHAVQLHRVSAVPSGSC